MGKPVTKIGVCVCVCDGAGGGGDGGWFIPPVQLFPVRACRCTTDCWNVFHEGLGTHKSSLESWKVCVFITVDVWWCAHAYANCKQSEWIYLGLYDSHTWSGTVQLLYLRAAVCSLMEGCGHWLMSSQLNCALLCALISNWHIGASHHSSLCLFKGISDLLWVSMVWQNLHMLFFFQCLEAFWSFWWLIRLNTHLNFCKSSMWPKFVLVVCVYKGANVTIEAPLNNIFLYAIDPNYFM